MLDRATMLRIAQEAASLHKASGQREQAKKTGRLDVYSVIESREIPLLFRPLDGLLGAYLDDPGPGILVTTGRPDPVQRFTAAHELGHATLKHRPSLDDDSIIRRVANPHPTSKDRQEEEANFFATSFLLPAWLVQQHAAKQRWQKGDLVSPFVLYQLSLRVGLSYQATCVALRQRNLINEKHAHTALATTPKSVKEKVLGSVEPRDYRRDVWMLTANDSGTQIPLKAGDYTVLELAEQSGSGYQWDTDGFKCAGAEIVNDERRASDPTLVGSPVVRRITVYWEAIIDQAIVLRHQRPWQGPDSSTATVEFPIKNAGQSRVGISDQRRHQQLEAA